MVLKLLQISYWSSSYIFRGWALFHDNHQFKICNSMIIPIHRDKFWKTNIGYILDDLQISVEFLLPFDVSQIDINCCLNFPTHQRIKTFQKKNYYCFFLFFCNGLNSNTLACDMMTCLWYTYSLSLDVQHLICH